MHRLSTSFVLGYHGCDAAVAESLLAGSHFKNSENAYDWLGSGVYFWEANPIRGLGFAKELQKRAGSTVRNPAVVGAVIDLGYCLDLLSSSGINAVEVAYADFVRMCEAIGVPVPQNRLGDDLLLRDLDCAVINSLHDLRKASGLPEFDSVRGVFLEGPRIYENSGFRAKTHIQICVRNHACIRGVFRVPEDQLES